MRIGYKLATEAFGPKELIRQAVLAEQAGFDFVELPASARSRSGSSSPAGLHDSPAAGTQVPDKGRETAMTEPAGHHSSDPRHHARKLQDMLNGVIEHAREDISKVSDPKAQALFETTAEVCAGLATAMEHYQQQKPAWQ